LASASRTARDPNNLSVHSVGAFGTNVAGLPANVPATEPVLELVLAS